MNIFCDADEIEIGDYVTLRSDLSGFEGASVRFCWQWYVRNDEGDMEWQDAPGGSGDTYTFQMTQELVNTEWRLLVIAD